MKKYYNISRMVKKYEKIKVGFWFNTPIASFNTKSSLFPVNLPAKAVKEYGLNENSKLKITVEILDDEEIIEDDEEQ